MADKLDLPAERKAAAQQAINQIQGPDAEVGERARQVAHAVQATAGDATGWGRSKTDRARATLLPHPVLAVVVVVVMTGWLLRRLLYRSR